MRNAFSFPNGATNRMHTCFKSLLGLVQTSNFTCAESRIIRITRFGNVRRLNQLGSTGLYLGRPVVLFDRTCRNDRGQAKFKNRLLLAAKPLIISYRKGKFFKDKLVRAKI